ncbi:MAG: serine/threonine-protein phosphatase [Planctomicrobium sp.]|nr:serine/threonine-protein phosphatase [Planctomicrobium sp.]
MLTRNLFLISSLSTHSPPRISYELCYARYYYEEQSVGKYLMQASHETMQCMEVWGGNSATWSYFNAPGLEFWIYSQPTGSSLQGGDVYYLSSCASGRTTRLLVGDVSGHGEEASPTADSLRNIMRQNVNFIDHTRLVTSINKEFEQASSSERFATAVVGTFFLSTRNFQLCNAGHPAPLQFCSQSNSWESFRSSDKKTPPRNLPFGIDVEHQYQSESCRLRQGDMILLYTDAISEALDESGELLGANGLTKLINSQPSSEPDKIISSLLESIKKLNSMNLENDDVTLLLARSTLTRVSLKNELLAPFRFLGR